MTTTDAMKWAASMSETNAKNAERLAGAEVDPNGYSVYVLGPDGTGECLAEMNLEATAQGFAESVACHHEYGVAVLRHSDSLYDFGDGQWCGFAEWFGSDDDVQLRPEPWLYP